MSDNKTTPPGSNGGGEFQTLFDLAKVDKAHRGKRISTAFSPGTEPHTAVTRVAKELEITNTKAARVLIRLGYLAYLRVRARQ